MPIIRSLFPSSRGAAGASRAGAYGASIALVEILLVVALAFILARLVWFIAFGASAADIEIDGGASSGGAGMRVEADLSPLVETEIFADRRSGPDLASAEPVVQETRLDLEIRALLSGVAPTSGSATIQVPGGRQQRFVAGDEIVDGVTLEEIHRDHIILSRRGIREALYLRERDRPAQRSAPTTPSAAPASSQPAGTRPAPTDPAAVIAALRLRPETRSGALYGLRITGDPSGLPASAPLRTGDIVTAINGRTLAGLDDYNDFIEDLEEADRLSLTLDRDGAALAISMDTE